MNKPMSDLDKLLSISRGLGFKFEEQVHRNSTGVIEIDGKKVVAYERLGYNGPVVDIFDGNGYTSIFFMPDEDISLENVKCYERVSYLPRGIKKSITLTRNSINSISINTPENEYTTIASTIDKVIHYIGEQFEPGATAEERAAYAKATGLPILYNIASLKEIYTTHYGTSTQSTSKEPPFALLFQRRFKVKKNKPTKKTQMVKYIHFDKQSFLDGVNPPIVMLSNLGGRSNGKGVFRRNINGYYVDNGSCEQGTAIFRYNTLPLDRILDMTEDLVKPLDKDFLTGLKKGPGALISETEMDLCLSLIGPGLPAGPTDEEIADDSIEELDLV